MKNESLIMGAGAIGVVGLLGYYLVRSKINTSSDISNPSTSNSTIGQASPYLTTGHLEDPLISQLLARPTSTIAQSTGTILSATPPTTITPSAASAVLSTTPSTNSNLSTGGSPLPTPIPSNTSKNITIQNISPITTTTTTTPPPNSNPLSNLFNTKANYLTGLLSNLQDTSQIQAYNPYYQPPTKSQASGQSPVSPSSTVGNIITGTAVNVIKSVVGDLGGTATQANNAANTYLNVTRPFVTTAEAQLHPVIAAVNTATADLTDTAANVAKTINNVNSAVNSDVAGVTKSIGNFFSGW